MTGESNHLLFLVLKDRVEVFFHDVRTNNKTWTWELSLKGEVNPSVKSICSPAANLPPLGKCQVVPTVPYT